MKRYFNDTFGDFKCAHCGNYVSANAFLSGVNNRNHCPYCLWSRHLDHYKSGDRMSACKALMEPVALTIKKANKKYGTGKNGELMIVHVCADCGKPSINRIAADDDSGRLLEIFNISLQLTTAAQLNLIQHGIQVLQFKDRAFVESQLIDEHEYARYDFPFAEEMA